MQSQSAVLAGESDIARRADSLARLDPEREAGAAIARGDLRFIAVCGYVCIPIGVPFDSVSHSPDSLAVRTDSLRAIYGTSDGISNQDVARLNEVAADYGRRYNRIILDRRSRLRDASRPAT
jgi:hypothetical protein